MRHITLKTDDATPLTINLMHHCAPLQDSFVDGISNNSHPPISTSRVLLPPWLYYKWMKKKIAASESDKDEEEESEGWESDGNKKSRRISRDLQQ